MRASRGRAGAVRQSHGTPGRQKAKTQWSPRVVDGNSDQQETPPSSDNSSFDNNQVGLNKTYAPFACLWKLKV